MERKDVDVLVRMTRRQKNMLEDRAMIAGLSQAEFIRRLIVGEKIEARPPIGSPELIHEVNKIGVNINQIAKSVNIGAPITERLLNDILSHQEELMKVVRNLGYNEDTD